jgi:hypothetical protein
MPSMLLADAISKGAEEPLSGCRLSRKTVQVVLPVHWPWLPSLPTPEERLEPPFGSLAVLRSHPTVLVPWPSRLHVLEGCRWRPGAATEAESAPQVRTRNFLLNRRQYRCSPTDIGLCRRRPTHPERSALRRFAFARFSSAPTDFHQTLPHGRALVTLVRGSLRQGPFRGLSPPFRAHAGCTALLAPLVSLAFACRKCPFLNGPQRKAGSQPHH